MTCMTGKTKMPEIAILLLAAGRSSRMKGRDKLAEQVDGQPLLSLICARARETGFPVYVTLPDPTHPRVAMAAEAAPVWVPDITSADLARVAAHHQSNAPTILRAAAQDGTPGHPVLFPRQFFGALQKLSGDQGARSILRSAPVTLVPLPDSHALTDLDTPEAWAAWRAGRKNRF